MNSVTFDPFTVAIAIKPNEPALHLIVNAAELDDSAMEREVIVSLREHSLPSLSFPQFLRYVSQGAKTLT